jgi:hypothetical protein
VIAVVLWGLVAGISMVLLFAPKPWDLAHVESIADHVRVYSWWAGLINLATLLVLASTTRWWAQALPAPLRGTTPRGLLREFWLCVGGAMAACAIVGYPRLSQSLWEDEE